MLFLRYPAQPHQPNSRHTLEPGLQHQPLLSSLRSEAATENVRDSSLSSMCHIGITFLHTLASAWFMVHVNPSSGVSRYHKADFRLRQLRLFTYRKVVHSLYHATDSVYNHTTTLQSRLSFFTTLLQPSGKYARIPNTCRLSSSHSLSASSLYGNIETLRILFLSFFRAHIP